MRKNWTQEELDELLALSSYCPPSILSKKIRRAESSVRSKLRELGVQYAKKEDWYKKRIGHNQRNLTSSSSSSSTFSVKHQDLTDSSTDILRDFWIKLIKYIRLAHQNNKKPDIGEFINTYRQINSN